MKITLLFAGVTALVCAIPAPGKPVIDAMPAARIANFVKRAGSNIPEVFTRHEAPPKGKLVEFAPPHDYAAGTVMDRAITCGDCHHRYYECVALAFVPGLPGCERVCMNRTMSSDEVCKKCDASTYPNYIRVLPPIKYPRPAGAN